jgi:hypothetical protein
MRAHLFVFLAISTLSLLAQPGACGQDDPPTNEKTETKTGTNTGCPVTEIIPIIGEVKSGLVSLKEDDKKIKEILDGKTLKDSPGPGENLDESLKKSGELLQRDDKKFSEVFKRLQVVVYKAPKPEESCLVPFTAPNGILTMLRELGSRHWELGKDLVEESPQMKSEPPIVVAKLAPRLDENSKLVDDCQKAFDRIEELLAQFEKLKQERQEDIKKTQAKLQSVMDTIDKKGGLTGLSEVFDSKIGGGNIDRSPWSETRSGSPSVGIEWEFNGPGPKRPKIDESSVPGLKDRKEPGNAPIKDLKFEVFRAVENVSNKLGFTTIGRQFQRGNFETDMQQFRKKVVDSETRLIENGAVGCLEKKEKDKNCAYIKELNQRRLAIPYPPVSKEDKKKLEDWRTEVHESYKKWPDGYYFRQKDRVEYMVLKREMREFVQKRLRTDSIPDDTMIWPREVGWRDLPRTQVMLKTTRDGKPGLEAIFGFDSKQKTLDGRMVLSVYRTYDGNKTITVVKNDEGKGEQVVVKKDNLKRVENTSWSQGAGTTKFFYFEDKKPKEAITKVNGNVFTSVPAGEYDLTARNTYRIETMKMNELFEKDVFSSSPSISNPSSSRMSELEPVPGSIGYYFTSLGEISSMQKEGREWNERPWDSLGTALNSPYNRDNPGRQIAVRVVKPLPITRDKMWVLALEPGQQQVWVPLNSLTKDMPYSLVRLDLKPPSR